VKPTVIDNFLPDQVYDRLREHVQAQAMTYGAKSNSQTDPHGHWSWKPVHDNQKNLADLTGKLPPLLGDTWRQVCIGAADDWRTPPKIIRCYANGYTYGTDGYFHTDSQRTDEQTFIIYICDDWFPDWAGETVMLDDNIEGGYRAVLPRPNRAVILPSRMLHAARAVSRKCTVLRTTFMFKTRPRRVENFERLSAFLVEHGALKHKHQEGTLHDHLCRVYQLLEDKKLGPATCYGGGIHSIYGTNAFKVKLLTPDAINRSTVAQYFGEEAEALAYMFSVLDRPKTLERPDGGILKLSYLHNVEVSGAMLKSLQLIEAANLLDQSSLANWPKLKGMWDACVCG
jgi:SM-20-related protein